MSAPRRPDPLMWLFGSLLAGGITAGLLLTAPLYTNSYAIGTHAIGLLVPFVGAMTFACGACVLGRFTGRRALASAVLFVLLCLPFAGLLASPIVHLEGDDSYRYSLYAHNILAERTLWGSDGLLHDVRHYVDQPGYRYYLAATIALLGGEHRGMQLFDMAVLLLAILALLGVLETRLDRTSFLALAFFLLASAPYAAKNVIYGYTEWFAVVLFMLFVLHLVRGHSLTAVILLALVPFVRQNLLIVSLILAGVLVARTRHWWLLLPYTAVLGLPLYHNLRYAGELRFFVENRGALLSLAGGPLDDVMEIVRVVGAKIPHYLGYHPEQELLTLAIAVVFAPYGSALSLWLVGRTRGRQRWLFAAIAAATIAPTLVLGSGSFPRFVYVNLSLVLLSCLALGVPRAGRPRPSTLPHPASARV